MSAAATGRGIAERLAGRRRPRLFATQVEEPRARRATDAVLLVAAAVALALLGSIAVPQAGFERALIALARSLPGGLDGLWRILTELPALASVALLVATLVRRRTSLLRDLLLAVGVVLGASLAWNALATARPSSWSPSLRLAIGSAVVMTASPHLSQPARRLGRWLVSLAAAGAVLLGAATPSAAAAGVLVAVMGAAAVHLAFGSSGGRPSLADVAAALVELGVGTRSLGAADRQQTGLFLVDVVDERGDPLVVKVYGRDAHDTQLVRTLWRTVWYREAGSPLSVGRLQQVEHEAFLTLLAGQAGVPTQQVVTAGATTEDDVLLVLRPLGRPLEAVPDRWTAATAGRVWAVLRLLQDTGIAHGQIDDRHLVVDGERVGLIDFRGATVAPAKERMRTDDAQALVTTVLALGEGPALAVAVEALGAGRLAATLPFIQLPALTPRQRDGVRQAGLDLDDLRGHAARLAGVEAPELQRLRRVTVGSVLQVGLLAVAFLALSSALAGLDLADLWDQLRAATWWLVAAGVLLAQLPRLAQAVSALGASPFPIPLGSLYALQLAQSYVGLAIPTSAARIAVNVRFFQHHGLPPGSALAVGALDGFSGFVVQASLLAGILLLTPASLDLHLDRTTTGGLGRLLAVVALAGLAAVTALLAVPRWRRAVVGRVRQLGAEALGVVRGLRSPRRVGMLLGGNLASDLLLATALGAFAVSLGYPVGLAQLLFVNVTVSLLAGLLPVPGGVGVVEGGLTLGLTGAGLPEEIAFAAALMYRVATFYLPPVWGFFALRWLERNQHL